MTRADQKFHKVLKEYSEGKLKSNGKKVTSHKQAIAIAFEEARKRDPKKYAAKKYNLGTVLKEHQEVTQEEGKFWWEFLDEQDKNEFLDSINETKEYNQYSFEHLPCEIKTKFKEWLISPSNTHEGMILKGNAHSEGGIKGYIVETKEPIEVEGDEMIINKRSTRIRDYIVCNGTGEGIGSALNELGGGKKWSDEGKCEIIKTEQQMKEGKKINESKSNNSKSVKFWEIPELINRDIIFDGDKSDLRLYYDGNFYWSAPTETEYLNAKKEIDNIEYSGNGWKIYVSYDVSGYEYWVKNQKEQNYAQITIMFDSEDVKNSELKNIQAAIDKAVSKVESIQEEYDFNPDSEESNEIEKMKDGGLLSKIKGGLSATKDAYNRSKKYTEDKIHNTQKDFVIKAIDKVSNLRYDTKDQETLEEAKKIMKKYYKEVSLVAKQLQKHEITMTESIAFKALDLVKPMISSVSDELTNTLGDNETMILIRVSKRGAPATILMIDTSKDFTIQGAKANRDSANAAKDKFIRRMREEGHLSDEEFETMKVCDNKFVLRGEIDKVTKKPTYIKKYYVIREFVEMLLGGRMAELTEKLMK